MSLYSKIRLRVLKNLFRFGMPLSKKDSNPITWGIIGLGYMAETMATAIVFSNSSVVKAVASRHIGKARKFASKHKAKNFYGSYEELINNQNLDINVIYIATPVDTHFDLVKACLKAGRNVICEKPMVTSRKQLEELSTLARVNNCFLMEAMWMQCLPTFKKALELVNNGDLGDLQYIRIELNKSEVFEPENHIKNQGVLANYGVYALSFMSLFIPTIPPLVNVKKVCISDTNVDSNWSIQVSNGPVEVVINLSSSLELTNKAIVIGEKGSLTWQSPFNRTNTIVLKDEFNREVSTFNFKYQFEGFEYQVNEVANCIRLGKLESSSVPLARSHATLRWLEKLQQQEN